MTPPNGAAGTSSPVTALQPKPYDSLEYDYAEGARRVVQSAGRALVLMSGGSQEMMRDFPA